MNSPLSPELTAYLDGDRPFEALSKEDRAQAEMWDRVSEELQRPAQAAPTWLEDQIMAEVKKAATPTAESDTATYEASGSWLTRPIQFRVRPLTGLLAAAALAGLLLLPRGTNTAGSAGPAGSPETVYVQFVLEAPSAQSVSVAGDFSEWEDTHTLDDPDGDGIWTGRIPLRPGMHQYMFVIDGADWVTDPRAERYADDGFGNRNAVIAVAHPQQVAS